MLDQAFDVIICARNVASTIAEVVVSARSAGGVGEVVVVDRQSTDQTARIARQSGARLVAYTESDPFAAVVAASSAQTFVFFSGDVVGSRPEHFEALAAPVCSGALALVAGIAGSGVPSRMPSLSPLRAMRRDIFEGIPHSKRRFPLETMSNVVAARRRARTGILPLTGCTLLSSDQPGVIGALLSIPVLAWPGYLNRLQILPATGVATNHGGER